MLQCGDAVSGGVECRLGPWPRLGSPERTYSLPTMLDESANILLLSRRTGRPARLASGRLPLPATFYTRIALLVFPLAALSFCALPAMAAAVADEPAQPSPSAGEEDPSAEAEERFVLVEGQVTDHMGSGQTDVTVTVRQKGSDDEPGEVIATATTDQYGDFSVTTGRPVPGKIVVEFTKANYTTLTRELEIGDDEYPPFLGETLEGNLQLSGRVINALTKRPLGGASVRLSSMYKDWKAETDDDGRFTIKGVFPGDGELVVQAKGYGRERQVVPKLDSPDEQLVSLKPERIVHLKTVSDKGQAIPGVTIECYDRKRDDFRAAVTDSKGSHTFRGLHFDATALSIRLTHESYVSSEAFDRDLALPDDKAESSHELVMSQAGRISGTVTDARTGKPVYGTRVVTGEAFSDDTPRDWASYDGKYTIQGVRPGTATVVTHVAGYGPELEIVDIRPGETTQLDFKLGPGAILKGIVKSASGDPVPRAFVETGQWRNHRSLSLRAMTMEDGTFFIENAPRDEFELIVGAIGTERVTKVVKAGSAVPIEITLADAPSRMGGAVAPKLKIGETAPDFELTTLKGNNISLASLDGKVILLDFWATWCGPCVADLPKLIDLHSRFGGRGDFVMISISLDWDESRLRDFVKKRKMTWPQVFGETPGAQAATNKYGVTGIPAVFLITGDGKLVAVDLPGEGIAPKVENMLKEKPGT